MSHYAVAVISKNNNQYTLDNMLAPFSEHIEVEPYIGMTKEEIIENAREKKAYAEKLIKDKKVKNEDALPEYYKRFMNINTDEEFYNANLYEDGDYDENGNLLSTYNPDSKWDWWVIGGRFSGMLKDKSGKYSDSMKLKDIDFTPEEEDVQYYKEFWEANIEQGKNPKPGEPYFSLYKPEYYVEKYKTKENFIERMSSFYTFALLTPEGEWLEPGKMGWFGMSSANTEEEYDWEKNYMNLLNEFDKECYITIVDCHI